MDINNAQRDIIRNALNKELSSLEAKRGFPLAPADLDQEIRDIRAILETIAAANEADEDAIAATMLEV